jgi:hypothetical protein
LTGGPRENPGMNEGQIDTSTHNRVFTVIVIKELISAIQKIKKITYGASSLNDV